MAPGKKAGSLGSLASLASLASPEFEKAARVPKTVGPPFGIPERAEAHPRRGVLSKLNGREAATVPQALQLLPRELARLRGEIPGFL